jgi:hypothetical protein
MGERISEMIKTSKYIFTLKDEDHGCGPKKKVERILSFDIPLEDPDYPKQTSCLEYSDLEKPIVRGLTNSMNGKLVNIVY